MGTSAAVQRLRLRAQRHCRGHGFHPWSGNQDPACRVARPRKKERKKKKMCVGDCERWKVKSMYIRFYSLFLCWVYEWPTLSWSGDFRDASKTVSSPPTSPRPGSAATASTSTSNIIPPRHQKPAGAPATKKKQQQKKKKGGKGGWWLEHSFCRLFLN